MSETYFENALCAIKKSPEIDRLPKILAVIRKEVEWPSKKTNMHKLQEKGCLKYIVGCLLKQHVTVLSTTLSILGNCCMLKEIVREAVNEHNILNNLSIVIRRHPQDSIRGRIFRILGNICQHHDYHGNLLIYKNPQLQIITNLISFLKSVARSNEFNTISSSSETLNNDGNIWSNATICMAIRTLRELVNTNTISKLVEDFDVIKAIGMIVIKFTPTWIKTRQYEDILEATLKLLHVYSNHKDVNLIPDLQNCGNGNAMDFLGKLLFLSPYVLVKIVMNLLKTSNLRSDLPIVDISENLIKKLGNASNFTNGREDLQHREYLKCLCYLMHHPANKEDLRKAGLISCFISILKDYHEETDISLKNCLLIISSLRICMYDEVSLLEMLKCNIINVLISKLNWAVGIDNGFNLNHAYISEISSKKRRKFITNKCFMHKLTSDGLGFPCCSVRSDTPCNYIKYNKERSLSPCSDISFSSRPSSPSNPVLSDDEDSDDYSPVCTDSEDNGLLQKIHYMETENMVYNPSPRYDEIEMSTTEATNCDDENRRNATKRLYTLCIEVVKLVKLFTKLQPAVMELVTTDLLVKLLSFLYPENAHICPPDTLAVILLIVETPKYLLRLMQTDFVTATYKLSLMSHGTECVTCTNLYSISRTILSKFTIIVESGSGKGDIAHQLHRANFSIKQKLVSAIPFVTGNKYIFIKLMIDCGGLNILIQSFQEPSTIQLKCICSLSVLALKLGIKNPAINTQENVIIMPVDINKYQLDDGSLSNVCFKLDDGSCVQADREFLCQKSEYFKCLLSGEFKESCENEISLHNVPNRALKLLLLLLQFDVNNTETYKIDADLDLLLDVVALSESYLLSDLCNCVITSIQYFKMLPSTVSVIYKWSLESGTDILRVESIAYALVAEMSDSVRDSMFSSLLELGYTDKMAGDVRNLLMRFLKPTKHL